MSASGRLAVAAFRTRVFLLAASMQACRGSTQMAWLVSVVFPVVYIVLQAPSLADPAAASQAWSGAVLAALWGATVWGAGSILRRELVQGTICTVMSQPCGLLAFVLGKCVGAMMRSILLIVASSAGALYALGGRPVLAHFGPVLLGLGLAILSALAISLVLGSSLLLSRAAVRLSEALVYPILAISGTLIPADLLPAPVRLLSAAVSFRWAHQMIVAGVRGGQLPLTAITAAAILTAGYSAIGYLVFRLIIRRARLEGTIEFV